MKAIEDELSDYLDDDLAPDERAEVEAHLADCDDCTRALAELRQVVARASTLVPTPPPADLWNGVAARIKVLSQIDAPRRFSFTLPQLAAASILLAALSGGAVALLLRVAPAGSWLPGTDASQSQDSSVSTDLSDDRRALPADVSFDTVFAVGYADAQYDAAVADLERALESGRGQLDATTITVVEENLAIIDRAIADARSALAADPSNSYLSGYLMEARKRKLDLLRRTARLTETN